jgi:zinc protease
VSGARTIRPAILALALLAGSCGDESAPVFDPGPETPVTPLVFPDEPFRATRPISGAAIGFQPPGPEQFQLDNGLQVLLVERRTVPRISWYLMFPVGARADRATGLASLCLNVAFQASTNRTRPEREQLLADLGSSVNVYADSEYVVWTGESLQQHIIGTAALWQEMFLAPRLFPEDFFGTRSVRLNDLSAGPSQNPADIASRVSSRLFWGRDHPFNRVITAQSLSGITLKDCQELFDRMVRPMGAKLFVSGAINRSELVYAFDRLATISGPQAMTLPPPPAAPVPGRFFFVNTPGAPQSIITLRSRGPARTSPDFHAAEMMAGILAGDSSSSRIGLNVRETRGYAYAIEGRFTYTTAGGSFFLSAPVRTDVTAHSVFEILDEIRKLREFGVTARELELERRGRLSGLLHRFQTGEQILAEYFDLEHLGVPLTDFEGYLANLEAVTTTAIQQAARSYLAPESLQILVVGDAQALPNLRAITVMRPDLTGSQLTVLDSEGNPTAPP